MAKEPSVNTFTAGANSDFSDEAIPNNMFRYMLNMRQNGSTGVVKNVKGNTLISFALPEGNNFCIGRLPDEKGNRMFYWVWNSEGNHSILQYNAITNDIEIVVQSPILNFDKKHKVINPVLIGDLLYWVDKGFNDARKINIKKAKDLNAYGGINIFPDAISAYKKAPFYPPILAYQTDETRNQNLFYGHLIKATYRYIYDDGEYSVFSDWSKVPLPINESYRGEGLISSKNNCVKISFDTGSSIVSKIEIAVKIGDNLEADFKSVKIIDKKELGIDDNVNYDYLFYNDGTYGNVSLAEVLKPYDFMPDKPRVQELIKDSIIAYANFDEGFEKVALKIEQEINYETPDFSNVLEPNINNPEFTATKGASGSYGFYFDIDGGAYSGYKSTYYDKVNFEARNQPSYLRVGPDVKEGNTYTLTAYDGFKAEYVAKFGDSAQQVLIFFRDRIYDAGHAVDNVIPFGTGGGYQLNLVWIKRQKLYIVPEAVVDKNNGTINTIGTNKSLKVSKENSRYKYAIEYETEKGKKYPAFSVDELSFINQSYNFFCAPKVPVHIIKILNRPPADAVRYQILRTDNLTVKNFLWLLVRDAITVVENSKETYLDLVIDSIDVYKKLYPNAIPYYQFSKGDRLRFLKRDEGTCYFPNYEYEILEQRTLSEETVNANVTTAVGSDKITVDTGTADNRNVGKYIEFDDENGKPTRRKILGLDTTDRYQVDAEFTLEYKRSSFKLIDVRNVLRIKKPTSVEIDVDFSLIEVFTPANGETATGTNTYYAIGEKYNIINPGLENRSHTGSTQNQDPENPETTPAIISIREGDVYMRNRELPENDIKGNVSTRIEVVVDKSYSDFYPSELNDNGKINVENPDPRVIHYGARIRTSRKKIDDTKINGLNSFDNDARFDYEDKYGDIWELFFKDNRLFVGKEYKMGNIPIYETLTRDNNNNQLLATSGKLLNEIQYYAWKGGIGKNNDIAEVGTQRYGVSDNSGIAFRHSLDGIEPISTTYFMDGFFKTLLQKYLRLKGSVITGVDEQNNEIVYHFESILENFYNGGFTEGKCKIYNQVAFDASTFEIVTPPIKGVVSGLNAEGRVLYTPNTDVIGDESFSFRVKDLAGEWLPTKNVCFPILKYDPPVVYANEELIVPFTKNNCSDGYHGSVVDFTVAAGLLTSSISQEDADTQAVTYAEANGQAYANTNGTCILNDADAVVFTDQTDLPLGTVVYSNTVNITGDYDKYVINAITAGLEFEVNSGGIWATNQIVNDGDTIRLRQTTSASYGVTVNNDIDLGGTSATWNITSEGSIPLPDFDFLKITYSWEPEAGSDLDTFTGLIDTGTAFDNDWVGLGQGDAKVPAASSTPYLWWAGDNTSGGKETVLVDFKQFLIDNPGVPNPINIRMNAVWYSGKLTGNVSVGITTYKNGTMSLDAPNFDFINTGGVVVSDVSYPTVIDLESTSSNIIDSQDVAVIDYDQSDNSATITLL